MKIVFLAIGTILLITFIILLFKGAKYDEMLEYLDDDTFPFKSIYSVGLALQESKVGRLKGRIGENLRRQATLMYSGQFSEYYARIIWGQMLTFGLITIVCTFLVAGCMEESSSFSVLAVGIVLAVFFMYYFYNDTQKKLEERRRECENAFPDAITKLALIVNSGVILHDAWKIVAYGNEGIFYEMMQQSCLSIDNGKADVEAIYELGILTDSEPIKKFTSALIQSIERGGMDLPQFLMNQTTEHWNLYKQQKLQDGEKAAGALLVPVVLMFAGILLIVLAAALSSF